jgi:hypothetical protein
MRIERTFVFVLTFDSVPNVPIATDAFNLTVYLGAVGVFRTYRERAVGFKVVFAVVAIASPPVGTCTKEFARSVSANCGNVTIMIAITAFVIVLAFCAVLAVSGDTYTLVGAVCIHTSCTHVANVDSGTFVDVNTFTVVTLVSLQTFAFETALGIEALGFVIASCFALTFIDIAA